MSRQKTMTADEHREMARRLWGIADRFNEAWHAKHPESFASSTPYYIREFNQKIAQLITESQKELV